MRLEARKYLYDMQRAAGLLRQIAGSPVTPSHSDSGAYRQPASAGAGNRGAGRGVWPDGAVRIPAWAPCPLQ